MTRGIYRTFNMESGARHAHVEYDSRSEMDITEQRYRERRYQPVFDALPWKDEYEAAKSIVATKTSSDVSPPQQA
jgi:hypothetical protein